MQITHFPNLGCQITAQCSLSWTKTNSKQENSALLFIFPPFFSIHQWLKANLQIIVLEWALSPWSGWAWDFHRCVHHSHSFILLSACWKMAEINSWDWEVWLVLSVMLCSCIPHTKNTNMEAELEAHIRSLLPDCVTLNILGLRSLHSEYDRFWRCELDF